MWTKLDNMDKIASALVKLLALFFKKIMKAQRFRVFQFIGVDNVDFTEKNILLKDPSNHII